VAPIALLKNIAVTDADTGGQTSTVGEPSVAASGDEIFLSGNWYATKSLDGGSTWTFVNPYTLLPSPGSEFCCDQSVLYDPTRNLFFWLLQYVRNAGGTNVLRLAAKKGGTLADDSWYWWDFSPKGTDPAWAAEWFDYPDLELSDNFLYLTTNSFEGEEWRRSVVFRFSLDGLAASAELTYRHWSTSENFSLRCVSGAAGVMHFASHNSLSQVRVFSWPETDDSPSFRDVDVSPWSAGAYVAQGPDGVNWLQRCDPRITGAWAADGTIGLAWTANRRGTRPFPYVRVVEIDEPTLQNSVDRDIWSPNYAYGYPAGCPSDAGEVGISLFRGGNTINPDHLVGVWNDATQTWELQVTASGTNGPVDDKWGDYLACRRLAPDGSSWIASGYTLQGGSSRTDIEPRVVVFRR
jgi:hypothetical protein